MATTAGSSPRSGTPGGGTATSAFGASPEERTGAAISPEHAIEKTNTMGSGSRSMVERLQCDPRAGSDRQQARASVGAQLSATGPRVSGDGAQPPFATARSTSPVAKTSPAAASFERPTKSSSRNGAK